MTFRYTLEPDDYLQMNLFVASRSPQVKKRALRNRIIIPILYLIIGLMLWLTYQSMFGLVILSAAAVVWALIYPGIQKRLYTRQYKANIAETYKNRFGKENTVTINDDELHLQDGFGESMIRMEQVNGLFRLGEHVFLRFSNGVHIIFPLRQIPEREVLLNTLRQLPALRNQEVVEQDQLTW